MMPIRSRVALARGRVGSEAHGVQAAGTATASSSSGRRQLLAAGWVIFLVALALAMASAVYVRMNILISNVMFVDWFTYTHAVDRVLQGAPLYATQQLAGPYKLPDVSGAGFAYPPSAIAMLAPFASWPIGATAWMILNIGLLITGFAAVLRREFGRLDPIWLALCTIGLALYFPFGVGVAVLNANVGLAGLYAWMWALQDSRALGPIIGLGGALKILPFAGLGMVPVGRRIRAILVAAAVAAAFVLVSIPLVGIGAWADYATALSNSIPYCEWFVSIACTVGTTSGIAKALGIAVAGIAFLAAWLVRSRLLAFALSGLVWLAPVTDMEYHYLILVYVLLVVTIAHLLAVRRPIARTAVPSRTSAGAGSS